VAPAPETSQPFIQVTTLGMRFADTFGKNEVNRIEKTLNKRTEQQIDGKPTETSE